MILDVTRGARLMWQKYGVLMTTWRKPPILLVQALFWGPWRAYQGIFELSPSRPSRFSINQWDQEVFELSPSL